MRPRNRSLFYSVLFLLIIFSLSIGTFAGKKRKSAEAEKSPKLKSKAALIAEARRAEKAAQIAHREKDQKRKALLAKKRKSEDDTEENHQGKSRNQRVAKTNPAKEDLNREQQRDQERDLKAGKSNRHKQNQDEIAIKIKSTEPEKTSGKIKSADNSDRNLLLKAEKSFLSPVQNEPKIDNRSENKVRILPPAKFSIRPVIKVLPRSELKFSIAKALAASFDPPPPPAPKGPDIIEVIEFGSPEAKKLDDMYSKEVRTPGTGTAIPSETPRNSRKVSIKIDGERVAQIQEALLKKGYYSGPPTGTYDTATEEAMRKFQSEHRIAVTGFPTAQSLKLLGLMDQDQRYQ